MGRVNRLITGLLVIIFCMSAMVKITDKFDAKAHGVMVSNLDQIFFTKQDCSGICLLWKASLVL